MWSRKINPKSIALNYLDLNEMLTACFTSKFFLLTLWFRQNSDKTKALQCQRYQIKEFSKVTRLIRSDWKLNICDWKFIVRVFVLFCSWYGHGQTVCRLLRKIPRSRQRKTSNSLKNYNWTKDEIIQIVCKMSCYLIIPLSIPQNKTHIV